MPRGRRKDAEGEVLQHAPLIFDGHNDVLCQLFFDGGLTQVDSFINGRDGSVDVPKAISGGFAGGFFAVFIPSPIDLEQKRRELSKAEYCLPLPEAVDWEDAIQPAMVQVAILLELDRRGALRLCRNTADIRAAMAEGKMAAILHLEGAEAIDPDLHMLSVLHSAGLRSVGPVWSRPTAFGYGVPLSFPASPDIGQGLTDHGIRLVKRCNELRVLIDLSHLNEAGFWDVARHSDAPLVATHSNAHAIAPHARNLTDDQMKAIAESDGLAGLNFGVAFLRDDGQLNTDTPISQLLRHLDYMIDRLGEDRVALGSDFDGALMPETLRTVAELPKLKQAMTEHGYNDTLIEKLCHKNWLRVLDKTWGSLSGATG
ncbi:dipeptidase [Halovulum sp. GXIMD14793]